MKGPKLVPIALETAASGSRPMVCSSTLYRLAPRGVAYPALQAALAAGNGFDRVRVAANMERWRWLPRYLGSDYLLVRLAAFELDWVRDGVRQSRQGVIVGKSYWHTPFFASQVTEIVVNPSWYVPPTIAAQEILPQMRQNAEYLARHGFQVWRDQRQLDMADIDW